jgi:uncharacterized membrane protein (UPF0127 family)
MSAVNARKAEFGMRIACALGVVGMILLFAIGFATWTAKEPAAEIVANPTLPITTYLIGDGPMRSELKLETAKTHEQQRRGLMVRDSIGEAQGMVFPQGGGKASFWMEGTRIPLDIAFVGMDGRVAEIRRGHPLDAMSVSSLVIEVPAGSSRFYGLKPGAPVVRIAEKARSSR